MSQFYDRSTTNIAKSQIGFIDFVIRPSYLQVSKVFPNLLNLIQALDNNKAEWTDRFEEYD